jgi:peptidyl-prolyl cis-trans isomerase D
MLQKIRDNSQGTIAKIIIAIIIVPFALFGIESLVGGGGPVTVAEVDGEKITDLQLQQEIYLQKQRLINQMGENVDFSMLDDSLLRGPALERLINKQVILEAAKQRGVAISDTTVDQAILAMPQFQQDGKFSVPMYENVLRSNGYSPSLFKQMITEDMLSGQLNSGISGSEFITEQELADIAAIIAQKRSFRYLTVPAKRFAETLTIEPQEIADYYQANAASFQTEEQVKLAYIELKQQDFFKPVDEEELKLAYEEEMASFSAREERRAAHILIEISEEVSEEQALAKAAEVQVKLAAGEDFSALVKSFSDDIGSAEAGGDLGYSDGSGFPPAFEEALANLQQGEVSEPVVTEYGVHLIKATEVKLTEQPSFEDRKPAIEQRLKVAAAEQQFLQVVEDLRDQVFNAEDLAGPAEELSLNVQQSKWLGREGEGELFSNTQIMSAAFSEEVLSDGNNSEVIELAADHFVVVRVLEHKPVAQKPQQEVAAEITELLRAQKASAAAQAKADEILKLVSSGTGVEEAAKANELAWQVQDSASRGQTTVNRELLQAVFAMPASVDGSQYQSVILASGDSAVVELFKVEEGQWVNFSDAEKVAIKRQLQGAYTQLSSAGFVETIRAQIDVETF